jgi:hypothetical protein
MSDVMDGPIVLLVGGSAAAFVLVLAAYICFQSMLGDRTAIWIGCFIVVCLADSIFRVRQFSDKSIDLQIIVKIVSWCYIFVFAVLRVPKYIAALTSAPGILWMILLALMFYSAWYSPNPSYSAVAAFSVTAFFLYFLSLETATDDLAVVLAVSSAIAAVAFISIIVYFAVPSLGRLSEWQGSAYVPGARMSGIVGTPNAMGEIAALGLVLLALSWREFGRRLGLLVPFLYGLLCVSALIMSYSRTSMISVAAILGINRMMRTRYLPWIALLAIGALVCVLVLVLYSEQVMIALSR